MSVYRLGHLQKEARSFLCVGRLEMSIVIPRAVELSEKGPSAWRCNRPTAPGDVKTGPGPPGWGTVEDETAKWWRESLGTRTRE
jgi:hypothetical protein